MRECDVVMKGGITSGVIYPAALVEFSRTYRLRSLGGASAGAIGAAFGAAAEFGRDSGGFDRLAHVPDDLADDRLAGLFQPQAATRPLLPLLLAATGNGTPADGAGVRPRLVAVARAAVAALPLTSLLGLLPGVALAAWGGIAGGPATSRVLLVIAGAVLALVGWMLAILLRVNGLLTRAVPANQFGICRGLATPAGTGPGLTDWLTQALDDLAGLDATHRPLRFGQLWTGTPDVSPVDVAERAIDLRMITTCLSQGRPYELPWEAGSFFYDPEVWSTLFPASVMAALASAPAAPATEGSRPATAEWAWEQAQAAAHVPPLRRLPAAAHLPVVVATRLSLSFPLLISAIPLWTVDRRDAGARAAVRAARQAIRDGGDASGVTLPFVRAWFTDGGMCSNFPVQLFDAALPARPTFAINLGDFPRGVPPSPDPADNIEYAHNNRDGLLPEFVEIPSSGWPAVLGFAGAAFDTARSWPDSTQLTLPGYRDRIVRVLQSPAEGGLNLFMRPETITALSRRGEAAAAAMVDQFTRPHYAHDTTGWDNHRWVRYRALLSGLPAWLAGYVAGRPGLDGLAAQPPSYALEGPVAQLASDLTEHLDATAAALRPGPDGRPTPTTVGKLAAVPAPVGVIRRVPRI